MKLLPLISALFLLGGIVFLLRSKPSPPLPDQEPATVEKEKYQFGPATRDGTGKFYLGREISKIMGHPAISWLERHNREDEEAPSKALEMLSLKPNAVIADIGAGSGYYTFRLAQQHSKGKVIAVDIQPEMISYLEQERETLGINNVEIHLGTIKDTLLASHSIDAALMVDAYHEFSHPFEMITSIKDALRPGGRIFLLEYRGEDPTVPIKPLHKMTQEQAKKEMSAAGLRFLETKDDLPWQHFMIFEKVK